MRKTAVAAALGAALAVGSMGGASAAPRDTANLSFFASSGSSAGWTDDSGNKVIELTAEAAGWAGGYFVRGGGAPLATTPAPSFETKADRAGASGGSARLTFFLSDGGWIDVRPDAWTGAWQTVNAAAGDVDNNGGCGFMYDTTWAGAIACHAPGTAVTDVLLVTDSGWLHGDHTVLLDDVSVNGKLFGSAADNRR